MNKTYLRMLCYIAGVVALLLLVAPRVVLAQGPAPVKLRVEVTDNGFNPDTIEVQQGQTVELTFVWSQQAYPNDEHIITLDGYKLESDKINSDHREATLKFIADKPGDFIFKCDLDCQVHDLLGAGHLKVTGGSGSGTSAALTPTKLTVSPSSWVTAGEPIILMAVLKDDKRAPVSKAEVRFTLQAEFAGSHGAMEIGTAKTDYNGVAFLAYRPTVQTMLQNITAQFDRMGLYAPSKQSFQIRLIGTPPSAYQVSPLGLPDTPVYASLSTRAPLPIAAPATAALSWSVGHWQEAPLVLLVGGVWAIFAYVLFQVLGIAWTGRRG